MTAIGNSNSLTGYQADASPVLIQIDLLKIQSYIFASNRLIDILGGSYQVSQQVSSILNTANERIGNITENVVFASGGNALILFPDETCATNFAAWFTRMVADELPGLEYVLVRKSYTPGKLVDAISQLPKLLLQKKMSYSPPTPLLGLAVTAVCRETRLPATAMYTHHGEMQDLADSILARRKALQLYENQQTGAWQEWLPEGIRGRVDFTREIDKLGRTSGDTSLIGIVHIDGDNISNIFEQLNQANATTTDGQLVEKFRSISARIDAWVSSGLKLAIERVTTPANLLEVSPSPVYGDGPWIWSEMRQQGFPLQSDETGARYFLPIRPIFAAGDDLTFACDGRIALDLAATVLRGMNTSDLVLGPLRASAGIAIVPAHTPLARAFELAEQLCRNAKARASVTERPAMDWHVGYVAPTESLENLRRREYRTSELATHHAEPQPFSLTSRPLILALDPEEPEEGTWDWLDRRVVGGDDGFLGGYWSERRGKLKALQEALAEGPNAAKRLLKSWGASDKLPGDGELEVDGFMQYYDALELLDLHLPLAGP